MINFFIKLLDKILKKYNYIKLPENSIFLEESRFKIMLDNDDDGNLNTITICDDFGGHIIITPYEFTHIINRVNSNYKNEGMKR